MKRVLMFVTVLATIVLIASCSVDLFFPKKADIWISNPSDASVDVRCVYFTGPKTITVPARGSRTAEVEVYEDNTEIMLFLDGKFYNHAVLTVFFSASGMNVMLVPNISETLNSKKANIKITNPSDAPVDVKCVYFTGPKTITISAHGSRTAEVEVNDYNTKINLLTNGRFYKDSNSTVIFRSSGMNVTLEPDVSWLAVHNFTGSTLKYVAFNDVSPSHIGGNYCFWDSSGEHIGDSTLVPGETGYIQFKKSSSDCGKTGWITCNIGMDSYATIMIISSPFAGSERDISLLSSSLKRVSIL